MTYIKFIILLILSMLTFLSNAQEVNLDSLKGIDITVTVKNIRGDKGKIYMGIYNNHEDFKMSQAIQNAQGFIDNGESVIVFKNVSPGTYAIKCYHDANDNHKMDFDGFMPLEDYGSTNNPREFGPPTFEAAKFDVNDTNLTFDIIF